jgi:thiamine monophosphate synthase
LVTEEGELDYLVFGPVFETASKPGRAPAGLDRLRAVVDVTLVPVLAVGGITVDRLSPLAATGAAGFAAIGLFAGDPGALHALVGKAALAFDASSGQI